MIKFVTVLILALAGSAFAQNPHFLPGSPTFTFGDTTVAASGSVAGLGNQAIDVSLEATGSRAVQCRNPGGNVAPGHNQEITVVGSQTNIHPENGRANFSVTTDEPPAPSSSLCPNPRWTAEAVGPVQWESATLTVVQAGEIVLQETATP